MFDIIIIGGGMAGMTSALYSLRNNKKVLVIEREAVGGQIAKSPKVENYPTIKQISGTELADELFDQITELGAEFTLENVTKVEKQGNIFTITTDYTEYKCKSVIIATGSKPRQLGIPGEENLIGNGISKETFADISKFFNLIFTRNGFLYNRYWIWFKQL